MLWRSCEYQVPIEHDPLFKGPRRNRSCTDIFFLILFLTFIGCWIGVGIYAINNGEPSKLMAPKDSNGLRCGLDPGVKDKKYLFFMDISKCFGPTVPFKGCATPQICVEKCPDQFFHYVANEDFPSNYGSYCIDKTDPKDYADQISKGQCPRWYLPSFEFVNRCLYNISDLMALDFETGTIRKDAVTNFESDFNIFWHWTRTFTYNFIRMFTAKREPQQLPPYTRLYVAVKGRCIPQLGDDVDEWAKLIGDVSADEITGSVKNMKYLMQTEEVAQNVISDVITVWPYLLFGILLSAAVCIIYIFLMRWIAPVVVWFTLIAVVVALSVGVYISVKKYIDAVKEENEIREQNKGKDDADYEASNKNTWLVTAILSSIMLITILVVLIFLRSRIRLAIALIEEGSKAVGSVMSVLVFPIIPWLLQIGIICYAVTVALYLSTTGEEVYRIKYAETNCTVKNNERCDPAASSDLRQMCPTAVCKFVQMKHSNDYPYLQAFNVFGFFWSTFFASAFGQMVLAYVFATWYWTMDKHDIPFFTVTTSTFNVLRYHIGTLAFGSLIIAICRMIRVILEYLDKKLKKYDNGCVKAILCCMKCFFWCLEKFLKFINKNAYIMCAIHGKNFCVSAKDAFNLLMRNIIRVFVLDKVTDFLFFLSKLLVAVSAGALAYFYFTSKDFGLNYVYGPVIIIVVFAYLIASLFFNVYSMAVDTLFLCFLEDSERNDGSPERPYFMSKNLMKILNK